MQHYKSIPIFVYDVDVKLGLDVYLADGFEIFLKIAEYVSESLLVAVTLRHLLVLELRTVSGELLHLYEGRWKSSFLHYSDFLAYPQVYGAGELAVLCRTALGFGVV